MIAFGRNSSSNSSSSSSNAATTSLSRTWYAKNENLEGKRKKKEERSDPARDPNSSASKLATLIRLHKRTRERLDNGRMDSNRASLASVLERYSSARRVRCYREEARKRERESEREKEGYDFAKREFDGDFPSPGMRKLFAPLLSSSFVRSR